MTPQEKAHKLIENLQMEQLNCGGYKIHMNLRVAKRSAIMMCDEIIEIMYNSEISIPELNYWQDVKQQIEQL